MNWKRKRESEKSNSYLIDTRERRCTRLARLVSTDSLSIQTVNERSNATWIVLAILVVRKSQGFLCSAVGSTQSSLVIEWWTGWGSAGAGGRERKRERRSPFVTQLRNRDLPPRSDYNTNVTTRVGGCGWENEHARGDSPLLFCCYTRKEDRERARRARKFCPIALERKKTK